MTFAGGGAKKTELYSFDKESGIAKLSKQIIKTEKNTTEKLFKKDGKTVSKETVTDNNGTAIITDYKDDGNINSRIKSENNGQTISILDFNNNDRPIKVTQKTENGDITTDFEYNEQGEVSKQTTNRPGQTVILEKNENITTRTEIQKDSEGNQISKKIVKYDGETPIYAEYEDSTRRQIEENGVITAWAKKDGKNISQQIQKDGKTYYVEYDGNGNTKGVVVQNGESPAVIAKKFGVSLEDLMQVNADKLKGKGNNRYFLVGEDILIPGEMDAEKFTKINSRRDTKAQAIGKYTAWVEAERAKKEAEAKAKAGNKDVEAQPRTGKCKHSKYKDYSYKVDPKTGKVSFFDKNGKQVDEKTRQAIINAEGEKAAAYLYKGAHDAGTNDKLIDAGIDCIYSKEIQFSANKWLATEKYGNYSHKNNKETNIEYLLRDEYSRSEKTDKVARIMQNGGYGNQTETNRAAIRYGSNEIKEINGANFYKSKNILNLTERIVTNRDIRLGIKKELGNKSIEQFWLENDHKNVVAQKISIKQVSTNAYEKGTDQTMRNKIVKKGMESYNKQVVEATLTAVDPTYKADYDNLTSVCKDINEQRKYKKQFKNQNAVQTFIDNYTSDYVLGKPNEIKINVEKIDQYNHNLYQFNGEYFEIPADIKAESFALSAKHDKDYSRIFTDNQDPEVYAAMQKLMDNNEISGIKDFNALYEKSNNNDPLIRANAILSGKVDGFKDEDIVNTAIALMHSIDSDNGVAKSGTTNKGYASALADKKTLVLERLILNNPHLKEEIKTRIEKEKFEEKYSKNQDAQTNNIEMHSEDTKYKYLAMLNNSYSYADIKNAKIYDEKGNEITDPAKKQQYINANKESLENLRAYIRQVERGFEEQLGTEGDYSTMADYLSRGLGLGTNREDVYNQYRKAKDMLANLDKAAEGRLLDKDGKPVSFEKYAKLCNVEIGKISEAQQKYTTTNSMFKTGIILAPIVVVTTVATGGSNVLLAAGASGTATYLIEEGVNTWERKTSLTGNTTERALSESTNSLIDGTIDAITVGTFKGGGKLLDKLGFLKPKHVTNPKSKTPTLDKAVYSKPSVNAEPKLQPSSSVRVGPKKAVEIKAEVHESVKGTTSGEELADLNNRVNSLNSRSVRRPMQNEISEKVDALPEPEQRAFINTEHKNLDSRIQDKLDNNRILNQSDARDIRTLLKQEEDIDYLKKLKEQISNNKIKHNPHTNNPTALGTDDYNNLIKEIENRITTLENPVIPKTPSELKSEIEQIAKGKVLKLNDGAEYKKIKEYMQTLKSEEELKNLQKMFDGKMSEKLKAKFDKDINKRLKNINESKPTPKNNSDKVEEKPLDKKAELDKKVNTDELPIINNLELVRKAGNNGKPVNPQYIQASREARAYLNNAISTGEYTKDIDSYINTMNEMHKISANGKSGELNWYNQVGQGNIKINPGMIRKSGYLSNGRLNEAREIESIAKQYNDPYRIDLTTQNAKIQKVKLQGIPEEYQPYCKCGNGEYIHFYPNGISIETYYYKEMHRTAKEALELINKGENKDKILAKIAEHYQYAANARPYGQINNSLFMNEVNTLLTKAKMEVIPHGMLDHAAQRLQPETFKKYFIDEYYKTRLQ